MASGDGIFQHNKEIGISKRSIFGKPNEGKVSGINTKPGGGLPDRTALHVVRGGP